MSKLKKIQGAGGCCAQGQQSRPNACCGQEAIDQSSQSLPWIIGEIFTPGGKVPQVTTCYSLADRLGSWKARWGIGRMKYTIDPGLYAVGTPDVNSPVIVTANYKMSFDLLRRQLSDIDLWILVLDTKGINIWCAAGKGSFGTAELVKRLAQVRLSETVTHRTLIVPQLGAPGVAAHQVFELSGFRVVYGPVRAADIPTYLRSGQKATPAMRQVHFTMLDRLVLTPVELVSGLKPALALLAVMLVINLALGKGASLAMLAKHTLMDFLPYFGAMVIGTVVFPLLLPYLPGRAFAAKGWFLGVVGVLIFIWATGSSASWTQVVEYLLLLPPIVSYLALNFTGCSTYTSFSGVAKEMKYAIPVQVISILAGIVLMLSTLFINP